ncbi:MAG: T9SS type A sorting domain-containing protein, partial [Bacteroidia bacterium]
LFNGQVTVLDVELVPVNVGISDIKVEKGVKVFPNPMIDETYFSVEGKNNGILKITEVSGNTVFNSEVNFPFILKRNKLASGIYFYELITDNNSLSRGKLIVR